MAVDIRGFGLVQPQSQGIAQGLGRGLATQQAFQQVGQQNIAAQREAQVRQALSGITQPQMQPQTEQQQMMAEQTAGLGGALAQAEQPQPITTQEEKIELARSFDPAMANKILKDMGLDDASKRAEMSRFASDLENTPFGMRREKIAARVQQLRAQGRDATQTEKLLDMNEAQQNQGLLGIQLADLTTKERFAQKGAEARQRQATQKAFAPVTIVNAAGEKRLVSPTVDNITGAATLNPFDIPEGFHLSKETDAEKRAADVVSKSQEKAAEITAKGTAERRQEQIDKGLEAADGMANIKRAKSLLDGIKTGGIDNASLKAKQFFGIEGADEAELSNRLGKAVLSQLKATFGAAFTAQEGQKLSDIEAGFGKSTEGNKRLLDQAEKVVLRAAKRGMRAARAQGDMDTVRDIEEALAFSLNDEATPPPPPGFVIEGQ
jgi:hypothetical protein